MKPYASSLFWILILVLGPTLAAAQEPIEDSNVTAIEKKAQSGIAKLNTELTQRLEEPIREATKISDFDRIATLSEER